MVKQSLLDIKFTVLVALKLFVFFCVVFLLVWYNMSRPRIMVLHSYDPDVDVVRDFNSGVDQAIAGKTDLVVNFYYMNVLSKKAIYQKVESGKEARKAVETAKPDILIAVGDEAQEFAAKFYIGHSKPRVVFAGVRGDIKAFGYEPGLNVAGVVEFKNFDEMNTLLVKIIKQKKESPIKIGHIGDQSTIVDLLEKDLFEQKWGGVKLIDSVKVSDFDNFKKAFKLLSQSCDVILLSNCRGLNSAESKDSFVPSKEVLEWATSETQKPIFSTFGYVISEGGDAAITSSFHEQGRLAVLSAFKMLEDTTVWPVEKSHILSAFINKKRVHHTQVNVPIIYESLAFSSQKLYE